MSAFLLWVKGKLHSLGANGTAVYREREYKSSVLQKKLKKRNVRPFSDGETLTVSAVMHHVFFVFGLRLGQLTDRRITTIKKVIKPYLKGEIKNNRPPIFINI